MLKFQLTTLVDKICRHVKQRYFLAVMCMMGHMLTTMCQHAFHLLMKEMIYKDRRQSQHPPCTDHLVHNNETLGSEEFLWSPDTQTYLLSSFPLGFYVGMVPIGLSTDRFGAKSLFGYSVFVPGVCSLASPLCARTSPYLLMANRILSGIFEAAQYPTTQYLAARWYPPRQQSVMLAIMFVGMPFGNIAGMYLSLILKHVTSKWVTLFYVVGTLCIIWAFFWQVSIWEDPFEHPYITLRELDMLADKIPMFANDTELEPGWKWPWREVLSSTTLWTLSLGYFGYSFFFNFALFILPVVYLVEIHNYNFSFHPYLLTFINLLMAASILASGFISDQIIHSRWLNTTHIVKVFYSVSSIVGSLILLGMTHSGCRTTTIILYYIAAVFCLGFGYTNWPHACLHIAPNFVGTSMAITSILGVIVMPFQLYFEESLTYHNTLSQWKTVSYLNAAISIFTTAIFLKWGNCQLRPWNEPKARNVREINYESEPASNEPSIGDKVENIGDAPATAQASKEDLPADKLKSRHSFTQITKSKSRIGRPRRKNETGEDTEEDGGVMQLTPRGVRKLPASGSQTGKSRSKFGVQKLDQEMPIEPLPSIIKHPDDTQLSGKSKDDVSKASKKHVTIL